MYTPHIHSYTHTHSRVHCNHDGEFGDCWNEKSVGKNFEQQQMAINSNLFLFFAFNFSERHKCRKNVYFLFCYSLFYI